MLPCPWLLQTWCSEAFHSRIRTWHWDRASYCIQKAFRGRTAVTHIKDIQRDVGGTLLTGPSDHFTPWRPLLCTVSGLHESTSRGSRSESPAACLPEETFVCRHPRNWHPALKRQLRKRWLLGGRFGGPLFLLAHTFSCWWSGWVRNGRATRPWIHQEVL